MEVEDTLLQEPPRGTSIERGESFEVENPPRLKRSKLLSGRSGGTDSVMDAFFSGFKTSLTASAGGDVVDGENGESSQRDSSALISEDDELCSNEGGENSARENPFDRNHGSDSRVRFLDSEEGGVVAAEGGSRASWTADGGALANGSLGHGDQDTILDDLRDGRGDEAEREAPELDGSQSGPFGSSDDRNDYLAGQSQRGVEMEFEAGSAARDGDESVQYPPQSSVDDADQDDKPLIGNDGSEENQADQENIDPSKMPFSDLFKTTKAKKSKNKKNKGKDGTDNTVAADDVTSNKTETELQNKTDSSDTKTDLAAGEDAPAILHTTENRDVTMTMGEGPQLTQSEGGVVEAQPIKADGSLPPETGREKQSLLHDHNPEGMICCVIL